MGFFDRPVNGALDEMFDWNRNGQIDPMEQSLQFNFISGSGSGRSSRYNEAAEYEEIQDEIDGMDAADAIEYIEDCGFDAGDFDFD